MCYVCVVGLSFARRLANSDMPTGPTLAACGDAIALKVACTAPLIAAVVESRETDATVGPIDVISTAQWILTCGG